MKKLALSEFIILLAGTLFAWSNFGYELYNWLNATACQFGCAAGVVNPFYTPCFYGALTFTLAFIVSIFILKKSRA